MFTFFTWLPRRPSLPPHGVLLSSHLCWFLFLFPNSKYWAGSSLHSMYPRFLGDLNSSRGFKGHLYSSDPLYGCLAWHFTTLQIHLSTWMSANTLGSIFTAYREPSRCALLPPLTLWSELCHPFLACCHSLLSASPSPPRGLFFICIPSLDLSCCHHLYADGSHIFLSSFPFP